MGLAGRDRRGAILVTGRKSMAVPIPVELFWPGYARSVPVVGKVSEMRKPLWAGCFFLGSLLLSACQKHSAKPVPDASKEVPAVSGNGSPIAEPTPLAESRAAPFKITLSTGGGFTGAVSGCTLGSDGQVAYWDKRGRGPEAIRWSVVAVPSRILEFRRLLEKGGALNATLEESGNMTTIVKLELPDTLRIWSWSGHGASETTPEPFRSWYPQVEAFCQSLAPSGPTSGPASGPGPAAPSDAPVQKHSPEPDRK
jgi:hypothetical protein